ncbi:MAG: hypothetical protein DHS20C16_12550 [Phycisphaerae bacterium]|nr:MAG: hypothetical protein DHS20C16_12550 [Phycisphaerae bacterium]
MVGVTSETGTMVTGPYKVESCVRCQYLLEGLDADHNCPECGLPIAASVASASFPFAYLSLRRQRLIWVSVVGLIVGWIGFYLAVNPAGFMTHDLYRLVLRLWLIDILVLLPSTAMFMWRCWQIRYISERAYLRPINIPVYLALLFMSVGTLLFFVISLVSA